jgi:tRNA-binding protein
MSFSRIDLRIGRIATAELYAKARKPAYKLVIDFGPLGTRQTSAQLTFGYPDPATLVGQLVVAVVNFPERIIATLKSQVLTTGFYADDKRVLLLQPMSECQLGDRVGLIERTGTVVFTESDQITIDVFVACKIVCGTVSSSTVDGTVIVDCGSVGMIECFYNGKLTLGTVVILTIDEERKSLLAVGNVLLTTEKSVPNGTVLL